MLAGLSDHNLILVARKLSKMRFRSCIREREFVGIPQNKQESFKNAVQRIDWNHILLGSDCDKNSGIFQQQLNKQLKISALKLVENTQKNCPVLPTQQYQYLYNKCYRASLYPGQCHRN